MEINFNMFMITMATIILIFAFIVFSEKLDKPDNRCYHRYGGFVDCEERLQLRLAQASAPIVTNLVIDDPKVIEKFLDHVNLTIILPQNGS